LLENWTMARDDSVRLASFLALRKLAVCSDAAFSELVLKGTYLAFQQVAKTTNAYSLPSINLMKNTASTLYHLETNQSQAYQIAFRYIRQLAITLRNSMKLQPKGKNAVSGGQGGKDKERHRQVYSWTFIHSIDFWASVLATACDRGKEAENGKESELRPLIYPLVQITLGVIKSVPLSS
jgi:nucleolar complex protein 2